MPVATNSGAKLIPFLVSCSTSTSDGLFSERHNIPQKWHVGTDINVGYIQFFRFYNRTPVHVLNVLVHHGYCTVLAFLYVGCSFSIFIFYYIA